MLGGWASVEGRKGFFSDCSSPKELTPPSIFLYVWLFLMLKKKGNKKPKFWKGENSSF